MNTDNFEPVLEHIAIRIGLRARASDRAEWNRAIASRMSVHRIVRAREYLQLLKSEAVDMDGEWRWLLPLLTNGESYFLRDEGQFSLLRNTLLPELVESRKHQKSLRLWSAGCSTGEEPYSLALLVQEIVPPNWNVSILGTDVNEDSLQKARRGVYSAWSFRALAPEMRERCFHHVADGFELDAQLRRMVRFERDNLCDNPKGQGAITQDMDLILCRNVLIYFQTDAVARAVSRFADSLREGGYLLTGHAELHHHDTASLRTRTFPESTAYQCCDKPDTLQSNNGVRQIVSPLSPIANPRLKNRGLATNSTPAPKFVPGVSPAGSTSPARLSTVPVNTSSDAPSNHKSAVEAFCLDARNHADAGRHDEAVNCCREAIAIDPVAVDAYFVWGQVAHEQGNFEAAKELFKKVIYLSPSHVEAYVELATMYDHEADTERAHRMRQTALNALRSRAEQVAGDVVTIEMIKQLERLVGSENAGGRKW